MLFDLIVHVDSNERKTLMEYLDDHADILRHYMNVWMVVWCSSRNFKTKSKYTETEVKFKA